MRTVAWTVPAPADLTAELIGVPTGTEVDLDIRLEAVMEGVLVTGSARTSVVGECARCLDRLNSAVEADFTELFCYSAQDAGEDGYCLVGDLLDLEPVLRDAVVLALPLSPVCREDCPGLCGQCGARLADAGPDHRHDVADPRWAALQDLLDRSDDEEEA